MVNTAIVKLYQKVTTKSPTNGQVKNTFPVVTARIVADVQPHNLTKEESYRWGQVDLAANAKVTFIDPNTLVRELDRIVSADGAYYEVRGINPWPIHWELLLVPVPGDAAPISIDGVTVDPDVATVVGELQLTAVFDPADATNKSVVWTSENEMVASVDEDGLVTAVDAGNTVITVTTVDGGFVGHCTVTVEPN